MKPYAERFYNSPAWKAVRAAYIQAVGGVCERCSTDDDPIPAKIVHHIEYITKQNINDPNVTLCFDNLQAVCQDCHNREHNSTAPPPRYKFDADGNVVPVKNSQPRHPRPVVNNPPIF